MTRTFASIALLLSMAAVPVITGCDHEVKHDTTTVSHSDGTMEKKDTTVIQKPSGDTVTETSKRAN